MRASIFLASLVVASAAHGNDIAFMKAVLDSQQCQGGLPLYREVEIDWTHCDAMDEIIPRVQCRDKATADASKANKVIRKYNDFVRQCQRREKSSYITPLQSKWQTRLGDAQERNSRMEATKHENDQRYEREVGKRMEETEKVLEQNAIETARQYEEFKRQQEELRQAERKRAQAEATRQRAAQTDTPVRQDAISCEPQDTTPRCDERGCWCVWWTNDDIYPKCRFEYWIVRGHCN